jgi:hypothetical protein
MNDSSNQDDLLNALDKNENSYLLDMTTEKMEQIKKGILQSLNLPKTLVNEYLGKLKGYIYLDEMNHLKYGSFIRYIPITDPDCLPLHSGGILCDIKVVDDGISLVCKTIGPHGRHFQLKFDEHLIFQKLTTQEMILLQTMDYLK